MSKVKLVVSSIAILAGAACAAPWYNGVQTEQKMRAELETLAADKQAPFTISITRFDHGWLASQAVSRVALKADQNIHVDVRHEIAHIPDRTSWVRVHSVPQWTGDVKAQLDYYFNGQPPLVVDTVYNYDGTRVSQFASPAFTKPLPQRPETTVTWGGMQGTLTLDGDAHYAGTATVPTLSVDAGDGQATLTGLKMDGSWDAHGTAIDWQGDIKLAIAEFRYVTALTQVAAKDIGGSAYQHSKGNNIQIGYALRVGSGSSAHAGEASQSLSNAILELEFDKLSKAAMSKYLSDFSNIEKLGIAPEARARLATQLVMKLGTDLLRGSPEVHLKKLGVETPSGSFLAHATVTFDGNNMTEMSMPSELLTRLKAKADVKISGTLLRAQLKNRVRPQVEVALREQGGVGTEENIRAMSEKVIEDQLKGYTDAGVLRAAGADYTVDAEFALGQMLVNGLPANQMLGGLFGAPAAPVPPQSPVPGSDAAAPHPAGSAALAERRPVAAIPLSSLR
jgi:uncharacterized protein YdgA (DUF945 family)